MTHETPPDLLVLHAVRTTGYASTLRLADLLGLPAPVVEEHLEDDRAHGWVTEAAFAGDRGWTLTEAGKAHGERLLAAELDAVGARADFEQIYRDFLPANAVVGATCTAWQLTELGIGELPADAEAIVAALHEPARLLGELEQRLTAHLARFSGYHRRFGTALAAGATNPAWITGTDRDSAHRVWFELHEDLIATLGIER
ncbi:hypothetical protein [Nocardia sp. NPDC057353]|uniref:hypothetical protein n=1 Tax=Nocardia sp. NPDC057353 TaxID=3346104 RepID=UPI00362C93D5